MIEKFHGRETAEIHLMGKAGESYKVAGLEPVGDIKMTDGVTDWTVSVTSDDNNDVYNTLHINAVKNSAFTPSAPNGLYCDENGVWNYYIIALEY